MGNNNSNLFNENILIYPNPTISELHIIKPNSLEISQIKIYNTLGQLIFESEWNPIIDVSLFSSGVLYVQFETNKGLINKTVLKN